jgi:hypothetical protein
VASLVNPGYNTSAVLLVFDTEKERVCASNPNPSECCAIDTIVAWLAGWLAGWRDSIASGGRIRKRLAPQTTWIGEYCAMLCAMIAIVDVAVVLFVLAVPNHA